MLSSQPKDSASSPTGARAFPGAVQRKRGRPEGCGRAARGPAFTLIEVLVVVAIIALLIAILLPSLKRARDQARDVQCLSHLRQIGSTMAFYGVDSKNFLPPFRYPIQFRYKSNTGTYPDPYWHQYLPYKYLHNDHRVAFCPKDEYDFARSKGRGPHHELVGGSRSIYYSYAMNLELPTAKNPTYQQMFNEGLLQEAIEVERYTPSLASRIKLPSSTAYLVETVQHNLLSGRSLMSEFRRDHGGNKERVMLLFADTHGENREFRQIWFGDYEFGRAASPVSTWPGRYRQLWFGDARATSRILY